MKRTRVVIALQIAFLIGIIAFSGGTTYHDIVLGGSAPHTLKPEVSASENAAAYEAFLGNEGVNQVRLVLELTQISDQLQQGTPPNAIPSPGGGWQFAGTVELVKQAEGADVYTVTLQTRNEFGHPIVIGLIPGRTSITGGEATLPSIPLENGVAYLVADQQLFDGIKSSGAGVVDMDGFRAPLDQRALESLPEEVRDEIEELRLKIKTGKSDFDIAQSLDTNIYFVGSIAEISGTKEQVVMVRLAPHNKYAFVVIPANGSKASLVATLPSRQKIKSFMRTLGYSGYSQSETSGEWTFMVDRYIPDTDTSTDVLEYLGLKSSGAGRESITIGGETITLNREAVQTLPRDARDVLGAIGVSLKMKDVPFDTVNSTFARSNGRNDFVAPAIAQIPNEQVYVFLVHEGPEKSNVPAVLAVLEVVEDGSVVTSVVEKPTLLVIAELLKSNLGIVDAWTPYIDQIAVAEIEVRDLVPRHAVSTIGRLTPQRRTGIFTSPYTIKSSGAGIVRIGDSVLFTSQKAFQVLPEETRQYLENEIAVAITQSIHIDTISESIRNSADRRLGVSHAIAKASEGNIYLLIVKAPDTIKPTVPFVIVAMEKLPTNEVDISLVMGLPDRKTLEDFAEGAVGGRYRVWEDYAAKLPEQKTHLNVPGVGPAVINIGGFEASLSTGAVKALPMQMQTVLGDIVGMVARNEDMHSINAELDAKVPIAVPGVVRVKDTDTYLVMLRAGDGAKPELAVISRHEEGTVSSVATELPPNPMLMDFILANESSMPTLRDWILAIDTATKTSSTGNIATIVSILPDLRLQPLAITGVDAEGKPTTQAAEAIQTEDWGYAEMKAKAERLTGVAYEEGAAPQASAAKQDVAQILEQAESLGDTQAQDAETFTRELSGARQLMFVPLLTQEARYSGLVMAKAPNYTSLSGDEIAVMRNLTRQRSAVAVDINALGEIREGVFIPNGNLITLLRARNNLGKQFHLNVFSLDEKVSADAMRQALGAFGTQVFDDFINVATVSDVANIIRKEQRVEFENITITLSETTMRDMAGRDIYGTIIDSVNLIMIRQPAPGEYSSYKEILLRSLEGLTGSVSAQVLQELGTDIQNIPEAILRRTYVIESQAGEDEKRIIIQQLVAIHV